MNYQNLKSIFASASMLCEKLENAEDVDINVADRQIKLFEIGLKVIEMAHKMTIGRCQFEKYEDNFNKLNPQIKNYDALPE